jgi:ABC-type polysaccharide/polyol phosphate export permease
VLTPARRDDQRWLFAALSLSTLVGAFLVSAQIRVRLPWGNALGADYDPVPLGFYPVLIAALALAYLVAAIAEGTPLYRWLTRRRHARVQLVAVGLAALGGWFLLPDLSQLQVGYFMVIAIVLCLFVLVYPARISVTEDRLALIDDLAKLWQSRHLLRLWLGYNIQSRYSQTILGILWIVLLPLSTAAVLALAFSQFLKIQLDIPFVVFFLCGLVHYGFFQQGVLTGMRSVMSAGGLISQVNFPREVLVLLAAAEALVDLAFTFLAMLIVNALHGIFPNLNYLYLPFLMVILIAFTVGLMLILSCLTMFARDVPQLVAVALQLLFYLTPIIYPVESIPAQFRVLLLLNPIAGLIQGFRDVIAYNRPPDLVSLYYPLVMALVLLYAGYSYFKAHEESFTDRL